MFRLSKLLEKLEDRLANRYGSWYDRNKKKFPVYVPVVVVGLYFYGMFINSLKLGTASTFHLSGQPEVTSIWVLNPFKNLFVLFTPYGLTTTAVLVLLNVINLNKP